VDVQVLNLVLLLTMRPSLMASAQAMSEVVDLKQWSGGHCPACGSAPRLAHLAGDGGHRTLHCSLCETAWPYRRIRCPFCDNDNTDQLVVLLPEGEEGLRVDLCEGCGQYVKTLDLRSLAGPVIPLLDDLATWHLDLIAKRHKQS
jgi:FdhE protein